MNSFGYILDLHLNAWDGRVKPYMKMRHSISL